jgi:metallo-beta-lactamase class B
MMLCRRGDRLAFGARREMKMIEAISVLVWLAGVSGAPVPAVDPLTRPIETSRSAEWLAPAEPEKIFGNTYLVGFGGMSVALIDTGDGLVLVDGALPQAAPTILANVRRLGFDPKDIKFILSTEPHFDHAGGLAALARDTGATVVASKRGAEGLRAGRHAADDPQLAYGGSWPAVSRVRVVRDGEVLKLGNTAIAAVATPGHTMGSMSWRWQACEAAACKTVVFASSLEPRVGRGLSLYVKGRGAVRRGVRGELSQDGRDGMRHIDLRAPRQRGTGAV